MHFLAKILLISITIFNINNVSASSKAPTEIFPQFLETLKAELKAEGLNVNILNRALGSNPQVDMSVIGKLKKQPEFKFTFAKYLNRLASEKRIKDGSKLYWEHEQALQRTSSKYKVPEAVILSLWGVESAYGKLPGKGSIIKNLVTLAYKSHRKPFFRKELKLAIKIVQEGHISLNEMQGSWAGAMGQCQFMPSSFFSFAADGNADGKKDIWTEEQDVFASTANYINKSGWNPNLIWGQRVILNKILPKLQISSRGLSEPQTVREWQAIGITPQYQKTPLPNGVTKARLFIPDGPSGKAYLVYNNFDVILKWNRSSYFAFAVLTLADKITEETRK